MSDAPTVEKPYRERLEPSASAPMGRARNPLLFLCLASAVACSGVLLLILESRLTFLYDEWDFLLDRRGSSVGVFLDPYKDHIALAPVTIYKVLLATFGMESALPFHVVSTFVFLLSAVLLFVYLRRRVGDWPALLGTGLILFLGASWGDLLWSFQIGFSGSIAAGLGALLALDRDDRLGDRAACVLLVVSASFSELGVAFTAGALVNLLLSRRPRAGRLYVALVPLALYAVWWLGWGHTAQSSLSLHNILTSPRYVFDAVSQAMASLLGLATPLTGNGAHPVGLDWGRILLVTAIGLTVWRLLRLGRVPRGFWVALAIGSAFWFLAAFNQTAIASFNHIPLRSPTSGRYQYPGAVFVLLIAAETLRGVRVDTRAVAVGAAVTAAAVISGLWFLGLGYRENMKPASMLVRASLAAIEIARQTVDPRFTVRSALTPIEAGPYLSAADAFGSPAYSEPELASSPEPARATADQALASALGIRLGPVGRASRVSSTGGPASRCRTVLASPAGETGLDLTHGQVTLKAREASRAEVLLARFSDAFSVDLGSVKSEPYSSLTIPADRSTRPWRLGLRGDGPVTVCLAGQA